MPGTSPAWTISRRQTRHSPKRRYTDRARPHRRQRVYARTLNLGLRCCFCTSAFFAIFIRSLSAKCASLLVVFTEREAERAQERAALVVGVGGGDDGDVHAAPRVDLVVGDRREDHRRGATERILS